MKRIYFFIFLALVSCKCDNTFSDEVDNIVLEVMTRNKEMINEKTKSPRFRIRAKDIKYLNNLHNSVETFISQVDSIDNDKLDEFVNEFIRKTFPDNVNDQVELHIPEGTSAQLVKLQIANYEYSCFVGGDFDPGVEINTVRPFIIPDKEIFKRGESISGEISVALFPGIDEWLNPKIEFNGKQLPIVDQRARFSLDSDSIIFRAQNRIRLETKVKIGDSLYHDSRMVFIEK